MTDNSNASLPSFANGAINLASARLGARGLYATDEFFAPLERMLQDVPASFDADLYDDNGKYMDGWESRRKRVPGHDWAIVKLAMPGRIFGFDVDTSYFTGNYPPHCSIDAVFVDDGDPTDATVWTEILAKSPLGPSAHHFFENAGKEKIWTHLRLHIYPDGGVARLRVYGSAYFDWSKVGASEEVDLGYIFNGAKSLAWSDAHYGHPDKMLGPGRGINMGDGWETKRRRGPGHDWAVIRLGHPGTIKRVIVDTAFFKGNFPDTCELLGAYLPDLGDTLSEVDTAASENWKPILTRTKLQMDHIHEYGADAIADIGPVTHVRIAMHPDGGIMRLRLFGVKG
ncbi:allantoicase [Rhizobium sp. SEMIA 4085]|uniref:Probable allantoicase n=1 Tax=Rhizobium gallicum bv. gallicum R602sp TaxID=1041138 RepID=A0A0B4X6H7_9HYPH|nr:MULTISPECIES: allantoicase [Rhizobium]AJD42092.1 allantoicase [Rhizobium gallicum bv. gallicum R602sp]NNH28572.1 allantoicase [Rhizobium sp. SEMIA 4085]TDW26744.1 allantoicase [Rhizobium azibense]